MLKNEKFLIFARNLLMAPIVLVMRVIPICILIVLEKIVALGLLYEDFLDQEGIYFERNPKNDR